ncbi:ThiF family adenylyltransferase [Reyranella sp.]|uniref:ThiF family adenylyltransferase n=1 Tax=Reyranella sp. TaxID=1929291 RepID=UPI0025E86DA6|nr:ThiF family adenylyltransferase [Reyranella sp.]
MTDWLSRFVTDPAFSRTRSAVDLPRLAQSRIVLAGAGGAAAAALDLARMGIGEFVLIDFDRVEAANIGTQSWRRSDIGLFKVEALARHLLAISPRASLLTLAQPLQSYNAACFGRLLHAPMAELTRGVSPRSGAPATTLLCGMTDSVGAQALINRHALAGGVPSLCVQIYQEGRAFELTFTCPGVTAACHRCILAKRFAAHESGLRTDGSSAGSPLTTTASANALTELVALALLHGPDGHRRWSDLLRAMGRRNLVQVRLDSDVAVTLGIRAFDRTFEGADLSRLLVGEPIWLEQARDPDCCDCGRETLHRWTPPPSLFISTAHPGRNS